MLSLLWEETRGKTSSRRSVSDVLEAAISQFIIYIYIYSYVYVYVYMYINIDRHVYIYICICMYYVYIKHTIHNFLWQV